ncbi:MAG TPA: hypothetical protein VGJ46_10195 [Candidatus Limnocylindrales bacterium]
MVAVSSKDRLANLRFAKATAWVLWVVAVGAAILGLTYGIAEQATGRSIVPQTIFSYLAAVAVAIVYASVGLSLIVRMPRLVIGWLFLGIGLVAGISNLAWAYALLAAARGTAPGPVDPGEVAWLANGLLPSAWFLLTTSLVLLFPDGHFVDRSWRYVLSATIGAGILLVVCLAAIPGTLVFFAFIANPHPLEGWLGSVATTLTPLLLGFLALLTILGAWSMRLRYLRAGPVEREQLKWFAWASGLFAVAGSIEIILGGLLATSTSSLADLAWMLFTATAITVPVAALIAITRYRLYDIDRLIGRTFVYGSLTAILAGVYAASIRLFTAFFVGVTGESSDTALVLTTLVLATSFTPIKQRLETVAGERFRPAAPAPTPSVAATDFDERVADIARRVSRELISQELGRPDAFPEEADGHDAAGPTDMRKPEPPPAHPSPGQEVGA